MANDIYSGVFRPHLIALRLNSAGYLLFYAPQPKGRAASRSYCRLEHNRWIEQPILSALTGPIVPFMGGGVDFTTDVG